MTKPTPDHDARRSAPEVRTRAAELCTNLHHALELDDWAGVAALAERLHLVAATQTRVTSGGH